MNKYLKIMNTSLQNNMEYRFQFMTTIICSFIPFAVNSLIWLSINNYSSDLYGYSLNEIFTYYFIMMIVNNLLQCDIAYTVCDDIRSGTIIPYLLKPLDYMGYHLFNELPRKVVFIIWGAAPTAVLFLFIRKSLTLSWDPILIAQFIVSLIIGILISFLLYYLLGLLAFTFSQVGNFIMGYGVLLTIISGKIFPLTLMPGLVRRILDFTPFQYTAYVPVTILQNKYGSYTEVFGVIMLGIVWVAVLYGICRLLWKNGLNKYSAFGG